MYLTDSRPSAEIFPGVHMAMPSARDALTLARSIVRVLADSNRTLDIVIAEELTSEAQLEHILVRGAMTTERGRALLRDRPELADTDLDELRALPDGTLGREFTRYLDAYDLDYNIDLAAAPQIQDPDAAYVLRRIRKNHDLWHVLLGLGPEGHEEVLVHAFTLSQVGIPSSVAIVGLGALKHMVLEGRWDCLRYAVRAAYELGRTCGPLITVRWEDEFARPIDEVRARYGIRPIDADGSSYAPT